MSTEHTCDECGESFEKANALGAHETFVHSDEYDAEYKDPGTLRELYHEEGMSTIEIADHFDVHSSTIQKYMERGGVERDTAYHDPKHPPSHILDTNHGDGVGTAYEKIKVYHEGEKNHILIHRLIAYAHGMLDFEGLCDPDTVVHHNSEHGLDNRPENLEVKGFNEHAYDHAEKRYGGSPWRDKERFKEMYREMSQADMAEEFGCSKRTVYVWKQKHGLE